MNELAMRNARACLLLVLVGCGRPPAPAAQQRVEVRAIGGDGVVTASLETRFGTLRVDESGTLSLVAPNETRVLDQRVIPELSYSNTLESVVYPRRTTLGSELVLRSMLTESARAITTQSSADRPAVSPDGELVAYWGSDREQPIVGLYVLDLASGHTRRVNNLGVAIGAPGFVEPPVERSFRFERRRHVQWLGADGAHTLELALEGANP